MSKGNCCSVPLAAGLRSAALLANVMLFTTSVSAQKSPPHIIMILADDLGWNDVSFHGSDEIPTPNIDALAYNGIILNQHYTLPLCTPSRAALLTGKFPIRTGMQHLVILENEPWGLGLEETLLPQHLAKAGYKSHAIGKWHLGYFKKEYLPTFRGFDSHFGYWQGYKDYYNHSVKPEKIPIDGFDLHRGLEPAWEAMGQYTTDLFTDEAKTLINNHQKDKPLFLYLSHLAPHTGNSRDPFQAPIETIAKFSHIKDLERRVYAAMVSKLDDSVGEIVEALQQNNMLDNSVIIFLSDNGGQTLGIHANRGSNFPFRGMKTYHWEGGTRGVAAIWSPLLMKRKVVSNQMMHLVDWVPTLCSIAGIEQEQLGELDGFDMWRELSEGLPSPRTEFIYNIDKIQHEYAAVRKENWKYVIGTPLANMNEWYGADGRNLTDMEYNPQAVIESKVSKSFEAYLIRDAILKEMREAKSFMYKPASEDLIMDDIIDTKAVLRLRREATVECTLVNGEECNPLNDKPCLFDLASDPCETNNIAMRYPHVLQELEALLARYYHMQVLPRNKPGEASADPTLWNGTYTPWHDKIVPQQRSLSLDATLLTLIVSAVILIGVLAGLFVTTAPRLFGPSSSISFDHEEFVTTEKSMNFKDPRF